MKLLLDEMHAPAVAEALRSRGIDAIAVTERDDLRGLSDADLLQTATSEGRAVVTENIKDFAVLDRQISAVGEKHSGLVYTHPRRFPRSAPNQVRVLADALSEFANRHSPSLGGIESFVWWLDSGDCIQRG